MMRVTQINWQTKKIKIKDLKDYEHNPRKMTGDDFDRLVRSLQEDGYHQRLVVNTDNVIIGGHSRKKALLKAGFKNTDEIEVLVPDRFLTEDEFDRINVKDNLPFGAWDFEILGNRFDPEQLIEWGMPGDWLDFDKEELDLEITDADDEAPEVKTEALTKLGDLWLLGEHRLLCGDASIPDNVSRLFSDCGANIMITDPPYGVKLDQSWRDKTNIRSVGRGNNANLVENDDKADWQEVYSLFEGNIAYVWHASLFTDVVKKDLIDCGFDVRQSIIWHKTIPVISGAHYHWKHEPCWYAVRKGKNANWLGDRKQTTVWDAKSPNQIFGRSAEDKADKTGHPTQKPISLFTKPIMNHTKKEDYIYDPFTGSGTSLIAADKTGRRCLSMELSPQYCDVIIKRWEKFTGKDATLEGSGKTFKELS